MANRTMPAGLCSRAMTRAATTKTARVALITITPDPKASGRERRQVHGREATPCLSGEAAARGRPPQAAAIRPVLLSLLLSAAHHGLADSQLFPARPGRSIAVHISRSAACRRPPWSKLNNASASGWQSSWQSTALPRAGAATYLLRTARARSCPLHSPASSACPGVYRRQVSGWRWHAVGGGCAPRS
jgi:hypothetical protein